MLGVEALPAALYCFLFLGSRIPTLAHGRARRDASGALQTLQLLHGDEGSAKAEFDTKAHQSEEEASGNVFSGKYNKSLLGFLLAFFNQLSGITHLYYTSTFENAGFASSDSLLSSISIGGTNLIFTFVAPISSIEWGVNRSCTSVQSATSSR